MIVSNSQPQVRQRQNFGLKVNLYSEVANDPVAKKGKEILSKIAPDVDSTITILKITDKGDLFCFMEPSKKLLSNVNKTLNSNSFKEQNAVERTELTIPQSTLTNPEQLAKLEQKAKDYVKFVESFSLQRQIDNLTKKAPAPILKPVKQTV